MIDTLHPDFALWKKASHFRETCEKEEIRLKRRRNTLAVLTSVILIGFSLVRISLSRFAVTETISDSVISALSFTGLALMIAGLLFLMVLGYVFLRTQKAAAKADEARNTECRIVMSLYKKFFKENG